jgi:hypothetical protein
VAEPVRRRLEVPGQAPGDDRLLGMIAALTSEVAVLRERLDTVERLAGIDGTAIDTFVPEADAQAARDALRRRLIAKVFRPLKDALARAAGGNP